MKRLVAVYSGFFCTFGCSPLGGGVVSLRVVRGGVFRIENYQIVLSFRLTRLCRIRAETLGRTIGEGLSHFPDSFTFRLAGSR